ncbi:MAG: hypothetical protein DRQ55_09725 [Planctomycetota bacterium]|nr:MAG: hypothetical protein DRQ55_09725 [Planctomycetota bacterium]
MNTRIMWASCHQQLACADHVPTIGSAAWWKLHWRLFGPNEQEGYRRARGRAPACEACAALAELASLEDEL